MELFRDDIITPRTVDGILNDAGGVGNGSTGSGATNVGGNQVGGTIIGGTYYSNLAGARVEIFPEYDSTIGFVTYNVAGTVVFKTIIDGANTGDVLIGNYAGGQGILWDQSAGTLNILGGIDISGKLDKLGGAYNSASSGARVRIFPDSSTGIQIIDDGGADVFKVLVGGTDVGDVIIGNYAGGQGIKYDKSAGTTTFAGSLSAASGTLGTITAGTLTGTTIQTSTGASKISLNASGNERLEFYASSALGMALDYAGLWFYNAGAWKWVQFVGSSNQLVFQSNTTGKYYYMEDTCFRPVHATADLGDSTHPFQNIYVSGTVDGYDISTLGGYLDQAVLTSSGPTFNHIHLSDGGSIFAGTTYGASFTVQTYSGNYGVSIQGIADTLPSVTGIWECGNSSKKWYKVTSLNYASCPLPTVKNAIDSIRSIEPSKLQEGEFGLRQYFDVKTFPDEMKLVEDDGTSDIELTRTIGVTLQAVKELVDEVDLLKEEIKKLKK